MAGHLLNNADRAAFLMAEVAQHNKVAAEWRERADKSDDEAEATTFRRYAQRRDYLSDVLKKEATRLKHVVNFRPQPKRAV